jgi:hypothetical protein
MSALLWVDGLFAEFCGSLSGSLREEARRLPFTLGFAPEPSVPWSHVFSHEVTLAAPALLAEAMPGLAEGALQHALFAHALAVIEAMGRDRIADGQVEATPALLRVLAAARASRDRQLLLAAGGHELPLDPWAADVELERAARMEKELLLAGRRVDFGTYEAISARKQAPGLVACAALAVRAGWSPRERAALRRTLLGCALGLQSYDDVLDWEDDAAVGRSWALALARSQRRGPPAGGGLAAWRAEVHAAGVLVRMLRRATSHFHGAARRARVLGARALAAWAEGRAVSLGVLAAHERAAAGYVHRARALAPWARTALGSVA